MWFCVICVDLRSSAAHILFFGFGVGLQPTEDFLTGLGRGGSMIVFSGNKEHELVNREKLISPVIS
jgi:hypothetical protein